MNIDKRIEKLEEENKNNKKWLEAIIELFHEIKDSDIASLRKELDELSDKVEEVSDKVDWHDESISDFENEISELKERK